MRILPIEFEIPFYKFSCKDWPTKKEKLKHLIEKNQHSFNNNDSISSVETTYFSVNFKEEMSSIIKDEINEFKKKSKLNVECKDAWFQVYNFMDNHTTHNHGFGYSGVLFINFLKGIHQPTHFLAPFNNSINGGIEMFIPDVEEGDILFFPSTVLHYAPSNRSQISRIIASMNFFVKKNQN
jgi:hypothetical protein